MKRPLLALNIIVVLLAAIGAAFDASASGHPADIQVLAVGDNAWLIKISQTAPGPKGWKEKVEMVVPRREAIIPVNKILRYKSSIEYNNGDSSNLSSPPPFGFVLFGSDRRGPVVEIRLVELFDKRDFVASSVNGVYHFAYPVN